MKTDEPLVVDSRFAGPPGTGNGGYVSGLVARRLGRETAAVTVTLRRPPPLQVPMTVTVTDAGVAVSYDNELVAEAEPAELADDPVDAATFEEAQRFGDRYPGLVSHPFPGCFVCGVDRQPGDGLLLRPGPVEGRPGTTAAAFVPDQSVAGRNGRQVRRAVVWAALDCPGGWTVDMTGRPLVLGRITAQVDDRPYVGDRCVVMGQLLGRDGRKAFTATTLYDGDGRVLGRARATWFEVDPQAAGRRAS